MEQYSSIAQAVLVTRSTTLRISSARSIKWDLSFTEWKKKKSKSENIRWGCYLEYYERGAAAVLVAASVAWISPWCYVLAVRGGRRWWRVGGDQDRGANMPGPWSSLRSTNDTVAWAERPRERLRRRRPSRLTMRGLTGDEHVEENKRNGHWKDKRVRVNPLRQSGPDNTAAPHES
jgi:hypothetical protein